jgi:hypothetical protein
MSVTYGLLAATLFAHESAALLARVLEWLGGMVRLAGDVQCWAGWRGVFHLQQEQQRVHRDRYAK